MTWWMWLSAYLCAGLFILGALYGNEDNPHPAAVVGIPLLWPLALCLMAGVMLGEWARNRWGSGA